MVDGDAPLLLSQPYELVRTDLMDMMALHQSKDRTIIREDNATSKVRLRRKATDLLMIHLDISSLARRICEVCE
jgi:hypothetical protein